MKKAQRYRSPACLNITRRAAALALCVSATLLIGCNGKTPGGDKPLAPPDPPSAAIPAEEIVKSYLALDTAQDSTTRIRARVTPTGGTPSNVDLTIYRKRKTEGGYLYFIEFATPNERDRSAIIDVSPNGAIEATRYVQASNTFASVANVLQEESLFGLTLQELAEGQLEKYAYTGLGEEEVEGTAAYKLEGKLKEGQESKFPRIVLFVGKDPPLVLRAEFYNTAKELARVLTVDEFEQVNGIWARKRWTIDNPARRLKVDFEATNIQFNRKLNDARFSREALKKAAIR